MDNSIFYKKHNKIFLDKYNSEQIISGNQRKKHKNVSICKDSPIGVFDSGIGKDSPIGVFDSGIGGITTLAEIIKILPSENYIYLADKSGLPYGDKSEQYILSRMEMACDIFCRHKVKAVVIACNTATNVGISSLRENYNIDFVGLEPSIKPAIREVKDGNILVLLTPLASNQQKFKTLLDSVDKDRQILDCKKAQVLDRDKQRLIISPQKELATLIEKNINDINKLTDFVHDMLKNHKNVSAVVLGCTHYVYLKDIINSHYNGNIQIFDGNEGAAKRLYSILEKKSLKTPSTQNGSIQFLSL